jgi:hypothetical protein
MSRNNARADPRFKKAVQFSLQHPTLTVPDAMKLADFSPRDQACRAKRMIVYRELDRFKKAVEFSLKHPALTVPEAMKLADFSTRDQACRAKRMIVYRELDKAKSKQGKADAFVTPPPQSVAISSCGERGTLSPVTFSETSHPSPPAAVAMKKPCATVTAAQLRQAEAAQKKKRHNAAFRRATITYDCERKKGDGGMSARPTYVNPRSLLDKKRIFLGVGCALQFIMV